MQVIWGRVWRTQEGRSTTRLASSSSCVSCGASELWISHVVNNLDRTFRTIDTFRRSERLPWKAKAYGSDFRNDMKALLAAHDRDESSALAEWVRIWSEKEGVRTDVRL